MHATLLLIDDDKNTREGLRTYLEGLGFDVIVAENGEKGLEAYIQEKPDLVLSDIRMPGMDGTVLLDKIKAIDPQAKVVLLTAYGSVEDAVKAMKNGAFYYLTKPVNLEELEFLVNKALTSRHLEVENQELKQTLFKEKFYSGEIIYKSEKMRDILKTVDKVAQSNATVLIEGESGTGKELIAHRIHQLSMRKNFAFIPVHCASLTETLLASELFGHEKGAFTGAVERKIGRFERAHQGTLFLDEIGEISKETQVKLLRVLQDSVIERVGSTKSMKVDVRLVLATNKHLLDEVRKGNFREDLYYRINVIFLTIPPLRERKEDIGLLVNYFIKQYAEANGRPAPEMTPEALQALVQYDWPGNVREVKNIVERMIVLSSGAKLTLDNIPEDILHGRGNSASRLSVTDSGHSESVGRIDQMEKGLIEKTLTDAGGNKSKAAQMLGISRRTLYRKIDEYKIS
ncbi:MAG: sigma-54-dependent Fis family transcriptional regulator [Candidatus Omnitrophica bacterium]|nr:sigma-54-dependent Fis family transcriptional regulator [Candidatus Omnitrophota bacterium]